MEARSPSILMTKIATSAKLPQVKTAAAERNRTKELASPWSATVNSAPKKSFWINQYFGSGENSLGRVSLQSDNLMVARINHCKLIVDNGNTSIETV